MKSILSAIILAVFLAVVANAQPPVKFLDAPPTSPITMKEVNAPFDDALKLKIGAILVEPNRSTRGRSEKENDLNLEYTSQLEERVRNAGLKATDNQYEADLIVWWRCVLGDDGKDCLCAGGVRSMEFVAWPTPGKPGIMTTQATKMITYYSQKKYMTNAGEFDEEWGTFVKRITEILEASKPAGPKTNRKPE
jgi:hypothetical protein